MLDNLGSLIDGVDVISVFLVFLFEGGVLISSDGSFTGGGGFVLFEVGSSLTDFNFGFGEGFNGVVTELGDRDDLDGVISDGALEIVGQLDTDGLVVFVDGISIVLLGVEV